MADMSRQDQPAQSSELRANQPKIIDLEHVETTNGLDSLTEATVKFESPQAREAREKRETASQAHKQRLELLRLIFAGVLILGMLAIAVYLVVLKPSPTEAQRTLGNSLLTAILGGVVGYAFGKQDGDKSGKE